MKILRFYKKPLLSDFDGISINGGVFEKGNGMAQANIIFMEIPNVFRFYTNLEIAENESGEYNMILTQFLTGGVKVWEMDESFFRIGFRDPEIEKELRLLCDDLVNKKLAYWCTL